MQWKDFFRLKVFKETKQGKSTYFTKELWVPENFTLQELMISQFEQWKLSSNEKKKLSLNLRKILLCHHYFNSAEFCSLARELRQQIHQEKGQHLTFSTEGGGIYLFLDMLEQDPIGNKRIICQTPELPLLIKPFKKKHPSLQLVYRPQQNTYLAQFPSLWQKTELLSLFNLAGKKSKVA